MVLETGDSAFLISFILSVIQGNNQCSVSCQDIELQYQQNPSGTMVFTTMHFGYKLNFSGEPETFSISVLTDHRPACFKGFPCASRPDSNDDHLQVVPEDWD